MTTHLAEVSVRLENFLAKLRLPAYFALSGVVFGVLFGGSQFVLGSGIWWVVAGFAYGIVLGGAFTRSEAVRRNGGVTSENARFRHAVISGEVSGDVSEWPELIRAGRKTNKVTGFFAVPVLLVLGVSALLADSTWSAGVLLPFAAVGIASFLLSRHQLNVLSEKLQSA